MAADDVKIVHKPPRLDHCIDTCQRANLIFIIHFTFTPVAEVLVPSTEAEGAADALIEAAAGFDHGIGHLACMMVPDNQRLHPTQGCNEKAT